MDALCVNDTDTGICRVNTTVHRVNTVVYAGRTVVYTKLHSVRRVYAGLTLGEQWCMHGEHWCRCTQSEHRVNGTHG